MNIRQRGPHLWQCVWLISKDPVTGKWAKRYETVESDNAEKVKAYWYQVRQEIDRGTAIEPSGLTVAGWLAEWLRVKQGQVRPRTYESYTGIVRLHLVPTLGPIRLQDLRAPAVQAAMQTWQATPRGDRPPKKDYAPPPLSPRTVRYCLLVLTMALDQAVKWQLVDRNVAALVDPPAVPDPPRTWWTADEAGRFLAANAAGRWAIVWQLALLTGLRQGEILGLQWTDVDWDAGTLTVRRTLDRHNQPGPPKTAQSARTLALDPETLTLLRQARPRTRGIWVIGTRNGTPVSGRNLSRAFKTALDRADVLRIRFHDLRHSHASLLLEEGEDLKVIADRLGHSQLTFTARVYIHTRAEAQRGKASALAARLRQDCGKEAGEPPQ